MGIMKTLTINGVKYDVTPVVPATSVTLLANAWVGDGEAYSQVVTIPGVTPNTKVDLQPTSEQLAEFHHKVLAFVAENEGGVVTVFAIGDKPAGDHTIQTTLTEVEAAGKIRGNTVGTTMPRPDWDQTDPKKADYIRNKPKVVKTVNGVAPDENGNVDGVSAEEKELILSLFRNAAYTADMSATFAQLAELWGIEVPDEPVVPDEPDVPVVPDEPDIPDEPEEPDVPVVTLTSISATYSGGDVPVGTAVSTLTGIVVTAHYSDGTSKAVTDYTLSGTIAEGSNTITVSYSGMTTTFAVTGVAEEEPETVSVRYEMPSETAFDGTNYVDTGVTLTDEDRDWTICLDYTPTAKAGRPFDISNDGTGGVYMGLRGGYFITVNLMASSVDIGSKTENMKIVLTHAAGSSNVNAAYVTASTEKTTHVFTGYDQNNAHLWASKNIILGADYTKANNFAQGTMHRFVVYNGVLDEAAINEFLGVSE